MYNRARFSTKFLIPIAKNLLKSGTKFDAKNGAKLEAKLVVKLDANLDAKLEGKIVVKHGAKLDTKIGAKLDAKHGTKLGSNSDAKKDAKFGTKKHALKIVQQSQILQQVAHPNWKKKDALKSSTKYGEKMPIFCSGYSIRGIVGA